MKIIIVGNGKVGYAIASQLAGERHDIVMVDDSAAALHKAENALDVMCIEGNGASIRVLKEAGVRRDQVVFCRVYTPSNQYWGPINEEYAKFFGEHKPGRVVVSTTDLHFGCLVEIEAIAELDED